MIPTLRICLLGFALHVLPTPAFGQDVVRDSDFAKCNDAGSHASLVATDCALINVPLDHAAPLTGTVSLFVRKFPAEGVAQGQLWLVAGGPGESGASFYPFIETLRAAAPGFDLLIPDHRGTGFSTRLCPNEEAPESLAGGALAGEEWGTCFGSLNARAERTRAFTITNAAHDLDVLMSRLGTGGRTYVYGVSYGTQLVSRLLSLAPRPEIDGVILDSLVPLETDRQLDLSHRSAVTDLVGRAVLRDCDARPECSQYFPEGAARSVRRLLERDDIEQLVDGNLKYQLAALLDFPEMRDLLEAAKPDWISTLQWVAVVWKAEARFRRASLTFSNNGGDG